jgi:nucleotide-binding universal stress UspA family protein
LYSSILIPVDRKSNLKFILTFVSNFLGAGGTVTFLNIVLSNGITVSPSEWRKALNAISTTHLLSAENGIRVSYVVNSSSSVVEGILDEAKHHNYDLILFATSSYHKRLKCVFGNKIDEVIRRSKNEVVVFSYFDDMQVAYKKILLPTSGYYHAMRAARMAKVLAKRYNSDVTVLYVGSRKDDPSKVFQPITAMFSMADIKYQALFKNGPIAETISAEAEKDYSIMIVGAAERQMLFEHLLGTTADKLIKRSPCPVIMIKTAETF